VPAIVVGETADGEERRCVVSLTGPTVWSDVISVVRACVHLEAHDKEGQVLRALDLELDDPELQAENESEGTHARAVQLAGSVPLISVDIPRLVDNLAKNMREVASEAARQQAGAFKEGFNAMTSVVNLCLGLLMRMDQRMADVEEQTAHREPQVTAPPDQRTQMAMLALQSALSGGGGNGAPANGGGLDMGQLMALVQQFRQQPPPEAE
jgi:hypothetical protein